MSDVTIIDTVETAETNLGNKIDGLNTTVSGLPQEVQNQLDAFKATIDELKKNVEDTLADVQETVENSPAGILPPALSSFSSQSNDSGILINYKANITAYQDGKGSASDWSFTNPPVLTKGIMFRYSDEKYPATVKEGVLAFIDEDIYDFDFNGGKNAKFKSYTITGLTNGKTYYISAFPYSTYNVYNESKGGSTGNRTSCQWTGTKGTLTVNVTQDYDYKPLGEYTATMTPTAGGQPITKTQSGEATIVFSSLEAGQYTLSFSNVASFTKPSNQSVTVTAGQSQTVSAQYQLNVSLSALSWAEIDEYSRAGFANKVFSVGDTKDVSVSGETLTFEIVGFNHDNLADGSGKAGITFGMKNLMATKRSMNSSNTNSGSYAGSAMNDYVGTTFYNGMPAEVRNVIKSVKKVTGKGGTSSSWSGTRTDNFKTWLFSEAEVFGTKTYSVGNEGSKYARFTSNSLRSKKLSNGTGSAYYWWLRSPSLGNSYNFCRVNDDGAVDNSGASSSDGVCVGFCV